MNIYKLIDGEFLRRLTEDYSRDLNVNLWPRIRWKDVAGSHRLFFYDALPAQNPGQSDGDYAKEFTSRREELDTIARTPNVFVKDGVGKFRRSQRRRQQKGVDILLAVDAALFATRGIADELHIYTSDLDFFPVFEALQSTSCRGRLFFQEGRCSDELITSADSAHPIGVRWLLDVCAMGPQHSGSLLRRSHEATMNQPPFYVGISKHGGPLEMRYHNQKVEIMATIGGRSNYLVADTPLLVMVAVDEFLRDPPSDMCDIVQKKFGE